MGMVRIRPPGRRLLAAVLVFALLAGVGTVFAGARMTVTPDVPATFQVAAPYDGDRGGYNVTLYRDEDGTLTALHASQPAFEFVHQFRPWILADELVQLHEVGEFRQWICTFNGKEVRGYESDLFLANGTVIGNGQGCGHMDEPILSESGGRRWRLASNMSSLYLAPDPRIYADFCGEVNLFQGRSVRLDALSSDLIGRCSIHYQPSFAPPRYEAIGTAAFGHEKALVVQGLIGQEGHQVPMTWWFVPSLPYPVKWVYNTASGDMAAHELAWFVRGDPPAVLNPRSVAPVVRLPWGKAGPAEDPAQPFPLSEAMAVARSDPMFADLREFEARHPDAVVQQAASRHRSSDTFRDDAWGFTVSDGKAALQVSVSRSVSPLACVRADCLPVERPIPWYQFHSRTPGPDEAKVWDPDQLPPVPSILDLAARYEAIMGERPDSWGISSCHAVCMGDQPYLAVGVNRENTVDHWSDGDIFFPSNEDSSDQVRTIYFDVTGQPLAFRSTMTEQSYGPDAFEEEPALPVSLAYSVGPTLRGEAWPFEVVAGTSAFAAFLVALGYYVWPMAKGGAVALFSRVQPSRVLDSPSRQRILQAIQAEPGSHLHALSRSTGLGMGALRHHLKVLSSARVVRLVPSGRYTCVFPTDASRADLWRAPRARSDGAKAVLRALRTEPNLSNGELARRTGLTESTVRYHRRRLELV